MKTFIKNYDALRWRYVNFRTQNDEYTFTFQLSNEKFKTRSAVLAFFAILLRTQYIPAASLYCPSKNIYLGSGGIRTHAIEMTGALNQRLRPLGHATLA